MEHQRDYCMAGMFVYHQRESNTEIPSKVEEAHVPKPSDSCTTTSPVPTMQTRRQVYPGGNNKNTCTGNCQSYLCQDNGSMKSMNKLWNSHITKDYTGARMKEHHAYRSTQLNLPNTI